MVVPKIVRKLLASVPYFRARRAYLGDRTTDALRYHSAVLRLGARPLDKAFHATLLILNYRSPEAKALFEDAIAEMEACEERSEARDYILNYCRYYEAMISGREFAEFRVGAEALPKGHSLHRLLPFPPQNCDA